MMQKIWRNAASRRESSLRRKLHKRRPPVVSAYPAPPLTTGIPYGKRKEKTGCSASAQDRSLNLPKKRLPKFKRHFFAGHGRQGTTPNSGRLNESPTLSEEQPVFGSAKHIPGVFASPWAGATRSRRRDIGTGTRRRSSGGKRNPGRGFKKGGKNSCPHRVFGRIRFLRQANGEKDLGTKGQDADLESPRRVDHPLRNQPYDMLAFRAETALVL